jgi:hypothetical protein
MIRPIKIWPMNNRTSFTCLTLFNERNRSFQFLFALFNGPEDWSIQIFFVYNDPLVFPRRMSLSNPLRWKSIHFHYHNQDNTTNICSKWNFKISLSCSFRFHVRNPFQSNVSTSRSHDYSVPKPFARSDLLLLVMDPLIDDRSFIFLCIESFTCVNMYLRWAEGTSTSLQKNTCVVIWRQFEWETFFSSMQWSYRVKHRESDSNCDCHSTKRYHSSSPMSEHYVHCSISRKIFELVWSIISFNRWSTNTK